MKRLILLLALTITPALMAERLSPLAKRPDWSKIERFQESMTRDDFLWLLDNVYAPHGAWKPFITLSGAAASIQTRSGQPPFVLRFASSAGSERPAERFWRQKSQIVRAPGKPLAGVRIAIDPGHLGGEWAIMEERWFQIGESKPVSEGDLTLYVASLLVPRLTALGADVYLTRSRSGPVTALRPHRLASEAAFSLEDKHEAATPGLLKAESERLFYRAGEIRQRAILINEQIKPDLVICLHFNAEAWGDPKNPTLTDANHLHLLVTGAFSSQELSYDDQRFCMLHKLLSRVYRVEIGLAEAVASAMARQTGLPPYSYADAKAVKAGSSVYVWARNLLANRLFECPVIYLEPYVMNSRAVFVRIQAGDYDGRLLIAGGMRKSIYREYADSIVSGLLDYYSSIQ